MAVNILAVLLMVFVLAAANSQTKLSAMRAAGKMIRCMARASSTDVG